jgi:hypothetical protein
LSILLSVLVWLLKKKADYMFEATVESSVDVLLNKLDGGGGRGD